MYNSWAPLCDIIDSVAQQKVIFSLPSSWRCVLILSLQLIWRDAFSIVALSKTQKNRIRLGNKLCFWNAWVFWVFCWKGIVTCKLHETNYHKLHGFINDFTSQIPDSIIHQKLDINSKIDAHRSVKLLAENFQKTIADQHNRAVLSLNLTNQALKSPTRDNIASKSQSIADQNFDACKKFSLAQITDTS